jgi:hypothetical protein
VPDPRTDRIAALARQLAHLDEPREVSARRGYLRARDELAALVRRGAPTDVVEAYRYRAQRAQDLLTAALHPPRATA